MFGRWQSRPQSTLRPEDRQLIRRVLTSGWWAVAIFAAAYLALDVGLTFLVEDRLVRIATRWILLSTIGLGITTVFTSRTVRMVSQSVTGERAARSEAEALAELAASIAAGRSIHDTLSTAVDATARVFGGDIRCSILLPCDDGLLRLAAFNHPDSAPVASFAFQPGEGFNGRAFSEGRPIRVDDLQIEAGTRSDVGRATGMRSLMVAPLLTEQRTLGVITTVSPSTGAFGTHEEQVLTAIARHVTVALVAAEARETAQREAAGKAAIIAQMADGVIVSDKYGKFIECNRAAARLLDLRRDELVGLDAKTVPSEIHSVDGVLVSPGRRPLSRAIAGETVAGEYRMVTHTGEERWVWTTASPLRDPDGTLTGGILVLRDVASRRQAIKALGESEERYRKLVELCPDPIVVYCGLNVVYANTAAGALVGTSSPRELIGRSVLDFVPEAERERVIARTRRQLDSSEPSGITEGPILRLNGEVIHIESTTMPVSFEGRPAIQAVIRDVTERKRAEDALAHQALHDALTNLPNRVLLRDRLEYGIATAEREGSSVSLLLMDLDRFKEVNDSLGHQAGDLLLQQLGARLRAALREVDMLARLGGDEFAVILPGTNATGANAVADNLLRAFQAPFEIEGQPVIVGASIGVAVYPEHGREADVLLRRADIAMYAAKRNGAGPAMYHAEHDRHSPDRLVLIGELRRAIDREELVLQYQPKIELSSGQLAGVEALVRWQHPTRGLLSPDDFVPIAEQAALIESLSSWVVRTALAQASEWRRAGLEISVAVNLSMRSLQDEVLPEKFAQMLKSAHVEPSLLAIEITESMLMIDPSRTLAILDRLRKMGVRVAIDDFGTGHSSLAYLKRLPVDEVKIDRAFIQEIATDQTDRLIVRSTVELAHSLGLDVVAEGVEDAVTAAVLAQLGCDQAQGFHMCQPLSARELAQWAAARRALTDLVEDRAA